MKTVDESAKDLRAPNAKVKFYITDSGEREWVLMWSGGGYLDTADDWVRKVMGLTIPGWYPFRTSSRLGDGKRYTAQVGWRKVANGNIRFSTDQQILRDVKTLFDDVVSEGVHG